MRVYGNVVAGLTLVAMLGITGCGHAAAKPSPAPLGSVAAPSSSAVPATGWNPAGTIPTGDRITGLDPSVQTLWVLLQTPANENHGAAWVGEDTTTTRQALQVKTPALMPPAPAVPSAWGITPQGGWWVAFNSQQVHAGPPVITTAVWQPGHAAWTWLPSVRPPATTTGTGRAIVQRGTAGNGWLIERFGLATGSTPKTQTRVDRLTSKGWQTIYTFPASAHGGSTWATAAGSGQLLVAARGQAHPVTLSAAGRVTTTWTVPAALTAARQISPGEFVVSSGIVYWIAPRHGQLWAWQGAQAHPVVVANSAPSTGFQWLGLWLGAPAVATGPTINDAATTVAWVYQQQQWTDMPSLLLALPSPSGMTPTGAPTATLPRIAGHTLWSVDQGTILFRIHP